MAYVFGVGTLADLKAQSKENPNPEIFGEIAQKILDRGKPEKALKWVQKAREAEGEKDSDFLESLGVLEGTALLQTDAEKGEAIMAKLAVGAENPEYGKEAFRSLSRHYQKTEKIDDLLSLYNQLLPKNQDDTSFLNGYAWFCAEQEVELEKAVVAAKRAVEVSEEDPGILDTLAEVYYKMGKQNEAVSTIDKALSQQPDDEYLQKQKRKFLGETEEKE